jgi:hypothetical protein
VKTNLKNERFNNVHLIVSRVSSDITNQIEVDTCVITNCKITTNQHKYRTILNVRNSTFDNVILNNVYFAYGEWYTTSRMSSLDWTDYKWATDSVRRLGNISTGISLRKKTVVSMCNTVFDVAKSLTENGRDKFFQFNK